MADDPNSYDDADEDEDDRLKIPAASPLPNPVIRSFDTPAQASTNTVPVAPAPAANRTTAQPSDDPTLAPVQPAPQTQHPAVSTDTPAAVATAPSASNDSTAPASAPAPQPIQQPAEVATSDDSGSTDSAAPAAPDDPFAANAAMYRQFHQNEASDLKYHLAQGGQTDVLPTGATVIKRDDDGNALYKPAVIQPFVRGDDGEAYRVSRDQYNNQHYFPLADGVEGQDYHVDDNTGEQYVTTSGADGSSKREVIGQDPLVPQITDLKSRLTKHVNSSAQANIDIAQATDGVQGGGPLAAASLGDLRDRATSLTKDLKPLKQQLDDLSSYTDDSSSPDDITQKKQLAAQVQFKQNILDQVQGEV